MQRGPCGAMDRGALGRVALRLHTSKPGGFVEDVGLMLEEEMRKLSRWMTAVCATALLTGFGKTASATPEDDVNINVDADDDNDITSDKDEYGYDTDHHDGLLTGFGTSVQVGGGVFGFTDSGTEDFMDPVGGSWTARLIFGTRMPLALEAAYIGTANNIAALGLDSDTVLLSNGAEGALRWNIISTLLGRNFRVAGGHIDPYVFGGIAYRHYQLINDSFNTSSVRDHDNVGEVPFGGGLAWMIGGFAVDLRGEYRVAFSDNLVGTDNNLNNWNASARLGWEF